MKKNLVLLALIGFAMFTLCGCGGKSEVEQRKTEITVKGADGTIYESYQECCAAEDFQAAHQYLAKMENSDDWQGDLGEAKEYVFKQEALYLMSIGDAAAQKRIIFLLKEEGASDSRIDMLMDLAIDAEDEDFVKSLTKQYKNDISSDILRKIVEFLYIEKGEGNLDFVTTLLNRYNQSGMLLDAAIEKENEGLVISIAKQFKGTLSFQTFKNVMDFLSSRNSPQYKPMQDLLVTKVEESKDLLLYALDSNLPNIVKQISTKIVTISDNDLVSKLAAQNKRECSDLIIAMIQAYPTKGHPLAPGHYSYDKLHIYNNPILDKDNNEYYPDHYIYCNWLPAYNQQCDKILDYAISNKNQYLAQKILPLFKKNIETVVTDSNSEKAGDGTRVECYSSYVRYYSDDINAAQKKYQEAVRSGAFK